MDEIKFLTKMTAFRNEYRKLNIKIKKPKCTEAEKKEFEK